jgi:hypothetical protein
MVMGVSSWRVAVVGLLMTAVAGCQDRDRREALAIPDSLMVQRVVPDIHGRAICHMFDSTPGYGWCDLGGGLSIGFRRDTIRNVTVMVDLDGDSTTALLDLWNDRYRAGWEARMGRVPDSLVGSSISDALTAIWNTPDSVRHSISLLRNEGEITMMRDLVDCRSGEAGGWCR